MRDDWLAQRWPALASACAQESVAGVTYAFALYSNALRERLGLSQQRLDLVATAENTSGILVPVIGLVMYLCGPRPTLCLAFVVGLVAWLGMWAAIAQHSWDAPFFLICLCALCQGVCASLLDLSAVACTTANFPERRGQAVGIVKAFVGLSAALCSSAYTAFFEPDVVTFILFIGLETGAACIVGALLLTQPSRGEAAMAAEHTPALLDGPIASHASRKLTVASSGIMLLVAGLVGGSLVAPFAPDAFTTANAIGVYALFLAGLLYLGHTAGLPTAAIEKLTQKQLADGDDDRGRSTPHSSPDAAAPDAAAAPAASLRDVLTPSAIRRLLLLFVAATLCLGPGLMLINNLASLRAARTGNVHADASVFVSLFSASNCAGRVISGVGSDVALARYGLSRAHAVAVATSTFGFALLLLTIPPTLPPTFLATALPPNLLTTALPVSGSGHGSSADGDAGAADVPMLLACLLGGFAYGGYNCLFPVCLSQLFAVELLPALYPLIFGPAFGIGSLLLSTYVYGANYDAASERHGIDQSMEACRFADCYMPAIVTAALSSAVASLLFVVLGRTSHGRGVGLM